MNKEIPTYNFIQTTGKDYLAKLFSWGDVKQHYNFHEPHSHTFHEILIFEKGGGEHLMGMTTFPVKDYSFHILPGSYVHQLKRAPL